MPVQAPLPSQSNLTPSECSTKVVSYKVLTSNQWLGPNCYSDIVSLLSCRIPSAFVSVINWWITTLYCLHEEYINCDRIAWTSDIVQINIIMHRADTSEKIKNSLQIGLGIPSPKVHLCNSPGAFAQHDLTGSSHEANCETPQNWAFEQTTEEVHERWTKAAGELYK